jgi:cytochrome c
MGFVFRSTLLGWLLCFFAGSAAATEPDPKEGQAARTLLEKAVQRYQQDGDKAFAAFSRQGEFVQGDLYVFVVDTHGVMLASGGPSVVLIGRDVSKVLQPDMQKIFSDALSAPQGQGVQQADYRWENWQDGKVERKHVYFQRIGERVLAVGYYLPRSTAEQAKALLDKAAAALVKDHKGTLTAINNLHGGFLQDDLYVFVVDLNTQRYVAHGTNMRMINTDFRKVMDPEGKPVGEPILALVKAQDQGEYEYRWRNPVTGKVENKHAYVRKVGDDLVAVGYYSL